MKMIPEYTNRPIAVLNAGLLGRRIACVFLAGGFKVHLQDASNTNLTDASTYIDKYQNEFVTGPRSSEDTGVSYNTFNDISSAVANTWLVIEAVPETLESKIKAFTEVNRYAPEDAIIASSSSLFKSYSVVEGVSTSRLTNVINMHFMMPPNIHSVELMSSGRTDPQIFPFLSDVMKRCGMVPFIVKKESMASG